MFHSFVTDLFFLFFSGDENDWSDWRATGSGCGAICLFCPVNYMDVDELLTHMTSIHDFDFNTVRNSKRLNFYQQVTEQNISLVCHLFNSIFLGQACQLHQETVPSQLLHLLPGNMRGRRGSQYSYDYRGALQGNEFICSCKPGKRTPSRFSGAG